MSIYDFSSGTIAARNGTEVDNAYKSMGIPIYMTNNYLFDDVQQGADFCYSADNGHCYTRISNPTNDELGKALAALEGAEYGIPFSTGVAAISTLALTLLKAGDHVICDDTTYSATAYIFRTLLPKFGVESAILNFADYDAVEKAVKPNTKLIYFETPCNPTMKVIDIARIARIAKSCGAVSAMDNTFATPFITKPIELGVDVVMHSTTKFICGHGDAMGGALVGPKKIMDLIREDGLKNLGGTASPFNSFLMLRGLKTLEIRMDRLSATAGQVAEFLEKHPKVERVLYPGLPSHPQYEIAKKQMKKFGGLLTFEVKGGVKAGVTLMNSIRLCALAVSLGEANTLLQHPASMTHWYVPKEAREAGGITDGLVRMAVGLENPGEIIADLNQALEKC
jgi:methionine-gamma-lyase